jgi:hypothetical protein
MVADLSGKQAVFNLEDHGQLQREWDRVVEAGGDGTLQWRNSAAWLNDMSFQLRYPDGPWPPLPPGVQRLISVPYPTELQTGDHIGVYHRTNTDIPPVRARVASVDRIRGALVVQSLDGGTFPERTQDYRWRIDGDVKDRFSFVVSAVFNRQLLERATERYVMEAWLTGIILEELPCHVSCRVHWLDEQDFALFASTYKRWQNGGAPLGDASYELLYHLAVGSRPGGVVGINSMHVATEAEKERAVGKDGTQWDMDYIEQYGLFYVPPSVETRRAMRRAQRAGRANAGKQGKPS